MIALKLPEDLLAKVTAEAERRGVAVDEMVSAVVREWVDEAAHQAEEAAGRREYDELMDHLAKQPGIYRFPEPAEPVDWAPVALPGKPLSEIIIEERGER